MMDNKELLKSLYEQLDWLSEDFSEVERFKYDDIGSDKKLKTISYEISKCKCMISLIEFISNHE